MSDFIIPDPGTTEFFRPTPGNYVGRFVGLEEAENTDYDSVRVKWLLFTADLQPIDDPFNPGEQATFDQLATPRMGKKAKLRAWLSAHRDREVEDGESAEVILTECIGRYVGLSIHPHEDDAERMVVDKGGVFRMDQPDA